MTYDPYPPASQAFFTPNDLADYECRHGRLPTDSTTPACGCYGTQDRGTQRDLVAASLLLADRRTDRHECYPRRVPGTPRAV
jgi:hypothetical protein